MASTQATSDETTTAGPGAGSGLLICLLFFLSGGSGLVYEVVWTRQLTTVFGNTLYAVSTVLAAFMGGLALGSILFGRRADKLARPLAAYGLVEIGVGVSALAFPLALRGVEPIIRMFYASGGEGAFVLFSLVRFVLVASLLLIPTTLMGATLPLMSRAVTTDLKSLGHRVGGLYALNTTGAVAGVFLTGFFLLESLGIRGTTFLAVGINLLVGSIALALAMRLPEQLDWASPEGVETASGVSLSRSQERLVLGAYFLSGLVALAYQVAWTRALVFSFDTLKSTTYSFSGMLVVFLLGLAVGSAFMQSIIDRQQHPFRLFALLQFAIGLTGALSFFVLTGALPFGLEDKLFLKELDDTWTLIYGNAIANVMIRTAVAIGLPTLLMGMSFPVVTRLLVGSMKRLGQDIGIVYATNTLGAIAGSFLGGFVLIPLLGIGGTIALLSALGMAMAVVLLWSAPEDRGRLLAVATGIAGILVVGRVASLAPTRHFQRLAQGDRGFVMYKEGPLATVTVTENFIGDRFINVDDVAVAGTDKILLTDQKSLAHAPMMLLGGAAERVLSVGFGSGGASYSYTLYPKLKEIHTIEIARTVLDAAPSLTESNHGVVYPDAMIQQLSAKLKPGDLPPGARAPLSAYTHEATPGYKTFDPRFHVIIDDARAYLRFTKVKYDVIATDCTDLRYKTNANLYDLQYFRLCREAITDRGMVVVWMPLGGLSDEAFRITVRTFKEVFPQMTVWFFPNQPTHYCLFIGAKKRLSIDREGVERAATLPGVAEDLDEIGLRDPDKLISCFVTDERGLDRYVGKGPLNTEDYPIIEFLSPLYRYDQTPLADNMSALYKIQVPASTLVTNPGAGVEASNKRIAEMQAANAVIFQGHCAYRQNDFEKACRFYLEAKRLAPTDTSIPRLLEFEELARGVRSASTAAGNEQYLRELWLARGLGRVYMLQERWEDAVTTMGSRADNFRDARKDMPKALREAGIALNASVAECYEKAGRPERAAEYSATVRLLRSLGTSPGTGKK